MMQTQSLTVTRVEGNADLLLGSSSPAWIVSIPDKARTQLVRMFRDPYVLEADDRQELIAQLRRSVAAAPEVSGLRVLLGIALCVDLDVQHGLDELRLAVQLAPESFIARLKLGELLMRLRICNEAAEHTHAAAMLSCSPVQAELARRQAATIRTMQREGIERGGYGRLRSVFHRARRRVTGAAAKRTIAASASR